MSSKYNLKTAYILSSVALFTGAVGFAHSLEDAKGSNIETNSQASSEKTNTKNTDSENQLAFNGSEDADGGIIDSKDLAKILKETDESGESLYESELPTTNSTYAQSQQSPQVVTASNWKTTASSFYSDTDDSNALYKSGKLLLFGIYDESTRIENDKLILEGWSSIINHTHVNGNNNKTYIVLQSGSKVTIVPATNVTNNLTSSWIWNKTNPSLRCREQTSDNNRPIAWTADGGTSKTQYKGCYHDNKNIGFKAQIPLETAFGKGDQNTQYSMYVVTSIGGNKILYKPLVSNSTKENTYSGPTSTGKVTYDAQAANNKASIKSDNDVMIRTTPYGGNNTTGATFKKGSYTITSRQTVDGVIWYKLSGQGISGWISSNYVIDKGAAAVLRYEVTAQKFNINFLKQDDKKTVISKAITQTVNNGGSAFNLGDSSYLDVTNGTLYYRIIDGTFSRRFNKDSAPADINLYYDDALDFNIEYKDASGKVVKTDKKTLNAGKSITTDIPKNTTFTANGSTYRTTSAVNNTRAFGRGLTVAQYNALKNTITINVEKQEEVVLSVKHSGVDYTNKHITDLSTESVKIKIYPSDGTKTYKVGAKGTSVTDVSNNLAKTATMTSGNWQFSNRGIDSDGNVHSNPDGTDNVNKGFENISINSATGAKSVTFNYMQDKFFYVNYMNQDNKALKVKDSVQQKLTWQKPDFSVEANTDLTIKGTNGLTYYRIYDGETKTHSRTLNQLAAPTDINLFYDNAVDFKIEYKDAEGNVVRTVNKTLNAGSTVDTLIPKNTAFVVDGRTYRNTKDISDSRTFTTGLTTAQYTALKNTITVNVERQEEITLNIKHNAVDINSTILSNLSSENLTVKLYPSEGNKTYKVASKGFGVTGAMNNVDRTTNMVDGKWYFSGRGVDSDGNVQNNPSGSDPVNKGYENFVVNSTTGAKSVTFNYMQEQADPNNTVQDTNNADLTLTGQFNWFLTKPTGTTSANYKESYAELNNIVNINGASYAKRNGKSTIKVNNVVVGTPLTADGVYYNTSTTKGINRTTIPKFKGRGALTTKVKQVTAENNSVVTNPKNDATFMNTYEEHNLNSAETKAAKNKNVNQEYSFEYTNEYIDIYKPATGYDIGGHIFLYEYTHTNTVWDNVTKVAIKTDANNKLDHEIGSTVTLTNDASASKNIGRYANLSSLQANTTLATNALTETIKEGSLVDNKTLKTQSHIGISGQLTYNTTFGTTILRGTATPSTHTNKDFTYKASGFNSYLVTDVDENFRETALNANGISKFTGSEDVDVEYTTANKADVDKSKFKIGLKATGTKDVATGINDVTIDTNYNYHVMKNSGLLIESLKKIDTEDATETDINAAAKAQYLAKFGTTTTDSVVYNDENKAEDRYYIPVDGASTLKPNTTYKNTYILSGVGLNDVEVVMQDTFKFEDYLVGDVLTPNVKFNTQKEPLINKGTDYYGQTVITPDTKNADGTVVKKGTKEKIKEISNENRTEKASNVRSTDSSVLWTKLNNLLKWK